MIIINWFAWHAGKKLRKPIGICIALFIFAVTGHAYAQLDPRVSGLPGSADASRAEERLRPVSEYEAELSGKTSSPIPLAKAPPGAGSVMFTLDSLNIDGNTVYTDAALTQYYAEYLGTTISVQTIYDIAARITKKYHNDGYILARVAVPEQTIDGGHVELHVIEGYIAEIDANAAPDNRLVRQFIGRVKSMRPLHMPTLERMLLIVNNFSGIFAKITLEPLPPATSPPGAVLLRLAVERDRIKGQFTYDNYGSRFIGPQQANASVSINDTLAAFDRITLRGLTTKQTREIRYGEIEYTAPLNLDGTSMTLSYSSARAEPGGSLAAFDLMSDSHTIRSNINQALIHTRSTLLAALAGLEWKDTTTDLLDTEFYRDRITVATLGLSYDGADAWNGLNSAFVGLRKGLDIFGARETGSPDLSRAEGRSDFTLLNASLTRVQNLSGPWQVSASLSGQYTAVPLLASEEFGIGGQQFGRAYDPSEITGDKGIAASLELRYQAFRFLNDELSLTPFVFYDIGKIWNNDTANTNLSLSSAGAGLSLQAFTGTRFTLTAAQPLTKPQDNPLMGNEKSTRWLFQLGQEF